MFSCGLFVAVRLDWNSKCARLQNLKDVGGTRAPRLPGGVRVPADWQREVRDVLFACLSGDQQRLLQARTPQVREFAATRQQATLSHKAI